MRKIYIGFIIVSFAINSYSQERGFIAKRLEAKDHIALIIGNSNYSDAPLNNPVNDATDVAKTFSDMGFIVEKVLDADKETMALAIDRFSKKLTTVKSAVFYYAGHGVQVNGENYLIPIGKTIATQITDESQVPYRAINAGEVLAAMEQAKVNFALVVLDACRNNPFKGTGRGRVPGLASINAPIGSLVMYATKAGATAADGGERNSPFTRAFLKHITTPGLDVNLLPSRITQTVVELTNGEQVPGTYMQLKSSFTFIPELTADEEKTVKEAQLKNLKVVDAEITRKDQEIAQKKKLDDEALAKKQAEIQLLDKQIAELKSKTSLSNSPTAESDLDRMLAFVKQKEAQKKELEELQKRAEENRIAREREFLEIKFNDYREKNIKIDEDIEKYKQIVSSEFGKDMALIAWDNILEKYGLNKGSVALNDVFYLKEKVNSLSFLGMNLVFLKTGTFIMGSDSNLIDKSRLYDEYGIPIKKAITRIDESPHTVIVDSFIMMRHEVTVAQFKQFVEHTGFQTDADRQIDGFGSLIWTGNELKEVNNITWKYGADGALRTLNQFSHPVVHVSWNDAVAYSNWLSEKTGLKWRLPTEAEWEYAARGGQNFNYSGSNNIDEVAWYASNSENQTHPVEEKKPNNFGLYDMSGNVSEWCLDWYGSDYYKDSPIYNPSGPSEGITRVGRGGSWRYEPLFCRISVRYDGSPSGRSNYIGFRLVLIQ